jgi:hypothetical protein
VRARACAYGRPRCPFHFPASLSLFTSHQHSTGAGLEYGNDTGRSLSTGIRSRAEVQTASGCPWAWAERQYIINISFLFFLLVSGSSSHGHGSRPRNPTASNFRLTYPRFKLREKDLIARGVYLYNMRITPNNISRRSPFDSGSGHYYIKVLIFFSS